MSLTERFAAAPQPQRPPAGWAPKFELTEDSATIITESRPVDSPGESVDVEFDEILEQHRLTPGQWRIKSVSSSSWQTTGGEWRTSQKILAAPTSSRFGIDLPDLDDLHRAVARVKRKPAKVGTKELSALGVLSDAQIGKANDSRGGTEQTLERLEVSRAKWVKYIEQAEPEEIVLVDPGDPIENQESHLKQARTNDLDLTEQIRVWRRVFWSWVETAASFGVPTKVIAVNSNHGGNRRGKDWVSGPWDDFGIEVLAQVADIAAGNPDKYGHVTFMAPPRGDLAVAVQLVGGKVLGVTHGHQVTRIEGIEGWWTGQSHGRTPVGAADILVHGHFHNMRISTSGDDRWIFGAPTADAGSQWFKNLRGHDSAPGVMTFCVGPDGWGGLALC